MPKTMSATEARVHFGALLRSVVEDGETIFVERTGTPQAVIISIDEYRQLKTGREAEIPEWRRLLDEAHALTRQGGDRPLVPSPAELIRAMRDGTLDYYS